ncbi:hypothetical protein CO180_01270 [candidate division WWE3 bacterium CG_4_9_14_3_um_filter_41_6]|uniref:YdbS-like PH domain-containing protein n=1 Tax=candidate division WWE3 bacterium CG_4_10_14_0_2_um_filter_41_14 TaxID=1975072 RepID=A0A2M7TF38_UNCKA|nr:MAG: hypothetical protein COY32_06420 [candidate division WWE3 bacterium CG_4_10_14_0_2_um_filter_41_14]PJA39239.1 MAG: hypothetical protein CO180_01270 [candidate division WWE3 bacterium CG_4_9_14_3_um_filter_41_6]
MSSLLNPFATFVYDPVNIPTINFETQRQGEVVHLMLRQDAITNVPWITITLIAIFIPGQIITLLNSLPSEFSALNILALFSEPEWTLISFVYGLAIFYYAFINVVSWFFNVVLVTNIRVVDVNFQAPFHTQTTQAQLQEIQDVRYTQGGIWGIIFNFGNLYIQTAGTNQNIHLKYIPNPNIVQEHIVKLLP